MTEVKEFSSIAEFLMAAPLYATYRMQPDSPDIGPLVGVSFGDSARSSHKFDGYCTRCKKDTVWTYYASVGIKAVDSNTLRMWNKQFSGTATCSRIDTHKVHFHFVFKGFEVHKFGQSVSVADIAFGETERLKKSMKQEDAAEFHRAVGLASHGIGIGSFVYLRRIFERMVFEKFNQHKDEKGWNDVAFARLRMSEKIDFLKDYLPAFLVENARSYSILSVGIHDLSDDDCLAFFPVLKRTIATIVEDDARMREDAKLRAELTDAISKIKLPDQK